MSKCPSPGATGLVNFSKGRSRSSVVRDFMSLVGSPMADRSTLLQDLRQSGPGPYPDLSLGLRSWRFLASKPRGACPLGWWSQLSSQTNSALKEQTGKSWFLWLVGGWRHLLVREKYKKN